jgi:hypothetical protein
MSKRGQATIMIIGAIVVLLIVGLVAYFSGAFSNSDLAKTVTYPAEIQQVADWNQECLEGLALEAVNVLGLQGGQYIVDDQSYEFEGSKIPYTYYEGNNNLDSLEQIETSIGAYIAEKASSTCYYDNPYLEEFSLLVQDYNSEIKIELEEVALVIEYPMVAEVSEGNTFDITNPYEFVLPVRVGKTYVAAFNIVEASVFEPNYFDYDWMLQQEVNTEILQMDDENYVFVLTDTYEEGEDYTFIFAGYFPFSEEDQDPLIAEILAEELELGI